MKKLILFAIMSILAITVCVLPGCNVSIGPGSYTFTDVHISDGSNVGHGHIESWHNDDVGIEVKTEEYGSLFLSEGTYILFNGTCPICNKDFSK